ncbi:hypothetical protein [Pseudomonas sp. StFLB209]|uniref:hypothetical protein n=2 Tax=unclassified Pseudomonas TaxID=196821 RepID=UPI00118683C7|nr:hypothetical protein [Pseudomonas sp. StFLB209]
MRQMSDRSPTAPMESGALNMLLLRHSADRMRYYFMFCFHIKIACDYLAEVHGEFIDPNSAIVDHATHQVDTGARLKTGNPFEKDSVQPDDLSATGWDSMDAAHMNNLGLAKGFTSTCERLGTYDPIMNELYSRCVSFCRDTRWLPQPINLGPDKVIDQVHRNMHHHTFSNASNTPCITSANITLYCDTAKSMLDTFALKKKTVHNTLAEAAENYKKGISILQPILLVELEREVAEFTRDINRALKDQAIDARKKFFSTTNWSAIPIAYKWFASHNSTIDSTLNNPMDFEIEQATQNHFDEAFTKQTYSESPPF